MTIPQLASDWTEELVRMVSALSRASTAREVAEIAITLGLEALGAASGAVGLVARDGTSIEVIAVAGRDDADRLSWVDLPPGERSPALDAFREAALVVVDTAAAERQRYAHLAGHGSWRGGTQVAVPLLAADRPIGYLTFGFADWIEVPPDDRSLAKALALQTAQALERARLLEQDQQWRRRWDEEVLRSQRLFEGIADASPDILYLFDIRRGRSVYVSRSVERVLGRDPDSIAALGDRFADVLVHPEDRAGLAESNAKFAALREAEIVERQYRLRHADGSWRWVRSRGRVFSRTAAGEPELVVGVARDVTDRIGAEREREELLAREQQARREAETASRAKDEFLAMLGHELRNPLSPMITALDLMRLRGSDAFERERTIIERQVHHLVRLVDDLLDVSRITRGKVHLKRRPVEVGDAIASALEMTSPPLESRGHRVEVRVPRSGLRVLGDPARLAQVFGNLLTNAAKYTEANGCVGVAAAREGDTVVVHVRDSGIGIPPELAPHVFDLFVQGKRALDRSQGGLGLGLTIVRSMVELHGGTVRVTSAGLGKGTDFCVELPLLLSGAAYTPVPIAVAGEAPRPAPASRRVLVVDDNRDAADALIEGLEAAGFDAFVTYDAPGALELAARTPPHVAFLDIGLPVMDGYELARRLRELLGPRVKLVALTGYGQDRDRALSRAAGFDEHLVKPVDLVQIVTVLRHVLDESERASAPEA